MKGKAIAARCCALALAALASCETPASWLAKNGEQGGGTEQEEKTVVSEYVVDEPRTGQDTVRIHLHTLGGASRVWLPEVKFNLGTPLVLISDDMSQNDLTMGWALFNGYAAGGLHDSYCNDFLRVLTGSADGGSFLPVHEPWTFPTDDGRERRWAMTTAVWPSSARAVNYTRVNALDALGMMRTGHSFAQHDVDGSLEGLSLEDLAARFPGESDAWRDVTGVGLKVMVEPNGDKRYAEAARMSRQVALTVCQATGRGWLHREGGRTYYSTRQTAPDDESVTHGVNKETAQELVRLRARGDLWVASMDEVWEWYYLRKHTQVSWEPDGTGVTVTLVVPRYPDHQFRELTVDVGADDVTGVELSANAVTAG